MEIEISVVNKRDLRSKILETHLYKIVKESVT